MGSLRIPAFLLVLLNIAVVQISAAVINMGMFPEVPDYSFYNCRDKMLEMVTTTGGLLQTELHNNTDFKSIWEKSSECKRKIDGGRAEHTTALQIFASDEEFRKTFNKKLIKSKGEEFPFKSLFFLLTDAMKLLKGRCRTVYSASVNEYTANVGEEVRFKSFYPAKQKYSEATEMSESGDELHGTVFNITSCSVISIDENVCDPGEHIDLLISPTEVFTVNNIRTVENSNNNYKEITLMHLKIHSSSNCSAFDSSTKHEETKESSSCFLSSTSLHLVASLLAVFFCKQTL